MRSNPTNNQKIIILGGGPNRIGQGIEFDYCCSRAYALKEKVMKQLWLNCNPETFLLITIPATDSILSP